MKKLIIAVIVFSFLGYGPLKTFFYNETGANGEGSTKLSFLKKLKDTSESNEVETFLIMEKGQINNNHSPALVVRYDSMNNKIEVASIVVPEIEIEWEKGEISHLKKITQEYYNERIDYALVFDPSKIPNLINRIAPDGIEIHSDNLMPVNDPVINGEEFVEIVRGIEKDIDQANEMMPIITALKDEVKTNIQSGDIVTIIPELIDVTFDSLHTDIGKGKLMELGLALLSNPVTSIESIQLTAVKEINKTEEVNKMLQDGSVPFHYE